MQVPRLGNRRPSRNHQDGDWRIQICFCRASSRPQRRPLATGPIPLHLEARVVVKSDHEIAFGPKHSDSHFELIQVLNAGIRAEVADASSIRSA